MTSDSCRPCGHKDGKWAWHTGRLGFSPLSPAWDGSQCVQSRTQGNSKIAFPAVLHHSPQHLPGSPSAAPFHPQLLGTQVHVMCPLPSTVCVQMMGTHGQHQAHSTVKTRCRTARMTTSNLVVADTWSRQRDAGTMAVRPRKAKRRLLSASPSVRKV